MRREGKATVSSYELEQRQPSYEVLIKLAAFFGVTSDFLLGLEKERTVSIEGLTEREMEIVSSIIELLRTRQFDVNI